MANQKTIGILLPRLNAGYAVDVLTGAHAVARQHSVRTIAFWGAPRDILVSSLARERIDGWLTVLNQPKPEGIHDLARTQTSLVIVGGLVPDLACPQVLPDNHGGVLAAVRHLIAHGHHRIAFVGNLYIADIVERYSGYRAALEEADIPLDLRLVFGGTGDGVQGYWDFLPQYLGERGSLCSAVVAANDRWAFDILKAAQGAGYRIPENLAVVGFDDLAEAQSSVPPLTTIHQSYPALGRTGAELLLAQIDGRAVTLGPTYVPTALIVRRSCGCASNQVFAGAEIDGWSTRPGWQDALARELVRLAVHPLPLDPTTSAAQVWPGVGVLLQGLEAAIQGTQPPTADDLVNAWHEILTPRVNLETLHMLPKVLGRVGAQRITATLDVVAAQARLEMFLDVARLELTRALRVHELARERAHEELMQTNYAVSMALLGPEGGSAASLAWMRQTPLSWGCLALWSEPAAGEPASLVVGGTYRRDGGATVPLGTLYAPAAFPPLDLLPASATTDGPDLMFVLPVRTATRDWGALAMCGVFASRAIASQVAQESDADALMWVTLFSAMLERENLLSSLAENQDILRFTYEQRLITANIRDLIFVIDDSGHFLYASPSFQQVLGYSPKALLGASVFDFVHLDDQATVRNQWTYNWSATNTQATFRIHSAIGDWRWLDVSGAVVVQQATPSIVCVGRDITERKQTEQQRLELAIARERTDLLRELITNLSHDLKTPLSVINSSTYLLERVTAPDKQKQQLAIITAQTRHLAKLIQDILALAELDSTSELVFRPLDVNRVFHDIELRFRSVTEQKQLTMVLELVPTLPSIQADEGELQRALLNLVENAVHYTPAGGVISLFTYQHDDSLVVEVRDTGIGISEVDLPHIFERFYRADKARSTDTGGAGLGLAIVKQIVDLHRGRITVESTLGAGSTFRVFLPLSPP